MTLTKDQAKAASRLFQTRPTVFDGTRAIVDQHAAERWHADVREAIHAHGVAPEHVNAFCDLAGVSD